MDFTWVVLLLLFLFFGGLTVLANSGSIAEWFFRRFQLRGMLRRHGWEDRTRPAELTGRELRALSRAQGNTSQEEEALHIAGTHRGHRFSAIQVHEYNPSVGERGGWVYHSTLKVDATGIPEMLDFRTSPLTGKITISRSTQLPDDFTLWLRRNRFRCHQFSTRPGHLTTRIGSRIFRRRLLRKLNFLIDVAENLPPSPKKSKKRDGRP